jgi:hypothetical protein
MNIAFQIEALTNSDGDREVLNIECDPTAEPANDALDASEIDEGAWEFRFVVSEDFDGSERVFNRFVRYRLDPEQVRYACRVAIQETQGRLEN